MITETVTKLTAEDMQQLALEIAENLVRQGKANNLSIADKLKLKRIALGQVEVNGPALSKLFED